MLLLLLSHSVVSDSARPHRWQPTRLRRPWDSPGKNTGVGCHALLHGIFLTHGPNPGILCLLHWQVGSWPLAPLGKEVMMVDTAQFKACQKDPVFPLCFSLCVSLSLSISLTHTQFVQIVKSNWYILSEDPWFIYIFKVKGKSWTISHQKQILKDVLRLPIQLTWRRGNYIQEYWDWEKIEEINVYEVWAIPQNNI